MSEKLNTTGKRQFGKKTQVGETIRWNKQNVIVDGQKYLSKIVKNGQGSHLNC